MYTVFADGEVWSNFRWGVLWVLGVIGLIGWAIGRVGRTKTTLGALKHGGGLLAAILKRR